LTSIFTLKQELHVKMIFNSKKIKLSLCLTNYASFHEDVWGSGCIDPRTLDHGTRWEWSASCCDRFIPGTYWYRRLYGPQNCFHDVKM
jgi:hypothetical protein